MEIKDSEETVILHPVTTVNDKKVILLGTAHVSKRSAEEVREAVRHFQPDTICLELCQQRYKAMTAPEEWDKTNILHILKEGRMLFLFIQMVLSAFYRKLGNKLEVNPGEEMLEGIRQAKENNLNISLVDRDVQTTLKRTIGSLKAYEKMKLFSQMFFSFWETQDITDEFIEKMKEKDQLQAMVDAFSEELPCIKKIILDERDTYISQKIRNAPGSTILAIVGAAHIPGILKEIQKDHHLEELETVPEPSGIIKWIKWLIPLLITGLLVWIFFNKGMQTSIESIYIWFVINGALSAAGAALALGHPLTIISAFVAAPFTSLNPMIAAGWVSGLVQFWVKKPTVRDFRSFPDEVMTFKGVFSNAISKIMLVMIFSNIGSSIGTFLAGWLIAKKL